MTNSLPCPNPACKHVFALAEIKGAATLTCPRCRRVFRFVVDARGVTRLVAPPTPAAKPGPGIDVELVTSRPAEPVARPAIVGIVPTAVVERHWRRAPGSRLSVIMGSLVAVLVVVMILGGYFMFRTAPEEKREPVGARFSAAPANAPSRSDDASSHREPDVDSERSPPRDNSPRPTEFLRGEHCEVDVPVGVWMKFKAVDEDEQGDLLLRGRRPDAKDDASKAATLLVVKLDMANADLFSAAKMVRDRLEQQRRAQNSDARLVQASAGPPASSEAIGERRGLVMELKLEGGPQAPRYILLAVLQDAGAVYGISCECAWDSRPLWQSDFRDVVRTFRIIKGTS
jgi:hypothetical protein